jgi:hypothetical protein
MVSNATVDSAFVLTTITTLIVLSRFVLRRLTRKPFKEEDYIMLFAEILHWVYTVTFSIAVSIHVPPTLHFKWGTDCWLAIHWYESYYLEP